MDEKWRKIPGYHEKIKKPVQSSRFSTSSWISGVGTVLCHQFPPGKDLPHPFRPASKRRGLVQLPQMRLRQLNSAEPGKQDGQHHTISIGNPRTIIYKLWCFALLHLYQVAANKIQDRDNSSCGHLPAFVWVNDNFTNLN